MIRGAFTVDDITDPGPDGTLVRMVRRDGKTVARIVDRTPYVPMEPQGPGVMAGTDPALRVFEPQAYNGSVFESGPLFGEEADAIAWLTE